MRKDIVKYEKVINKHRNYIKLKIKNLKWYELKKQIKYNIIKIKLDRRYSKIFDEYLYELARRDNYIREKELLKARAIIKATIEELFKEKEKKNKTP